MYDGKEMVGGKSCVRDRRWSCWHFAPRRVVCARKFIVLYLDRRCSYSRAAIIDAELSLRSEERREGLKEKKLSYDFHDSVNPRVVAVERGSSRNVSQALRRVSEMRTGEVERCRFDNRSAITRTANYDFDR